MKTTCDKEADALYVKFVEGDVVESEEVSPGLVLDFDRDGKIAAIEVLADFQNTTLVNTTYSQKILQI